MRLSSPVTLSRAPLVLSSIYPGTTSFSHPFASSFNFHHSFSICLCCVFLPCTLCITCCAVHLPRSPTSNTLSTFSGIHLLPCRPILSCPLPSPKLGPTTGCTQCTIVCFGAELQQCSVEHNRQKCIRRRSQALGGLGRRGCYLGQQLIAAHPLRLYPLGMQHATLSSSHIQAKHYPLKAGQI